MNINMLIEKINKIKSNPDYNKDEINSIIEEADSPEKEVLFIYSNFGKFYSINKDNRRFLIDNFHKILERDLFDRKINNMLYISYIDAQYKDYNYYESEEVYNKMEKNNIDDMKVFLGLAEYTMITRRYDESTEYLNKAKTICNDDYYLNFIEKKLEELDIKKNSTGYLPASQENREKYKLFMKSLGITIDLPIVRTKASNKIPVGEYPKAIELKEAGFKSFVAFDVETTGIDHSKDSITELAAIRVVDGVVDENDKFIFQELVHPYKVKISKDVEHLTGITNEMVYNCREIWEVFNDFADWLGDDILLGYNCMTFDSKFLIRAGRLSNRIINNKYFDVMKYAKKYNKEIGSDDLKLTNIGLSLGIKNPQAHRALADAITTAKVYLELLKKFNN